MGNKISRSKDRPRSRSDVSPLPNGAHDKVEEGGRNKNPQTPQRANLDFCEFIYTFDDVYHLGTIPIATILEHVGFEAAHGYRTIIIHIRTLTLFVEAFMERDIRTNEEAAIRARGWWRIRREVLAEFHQYQAAYHHSMETDGATLEMLANNQRRAMEHSTQLSSDPRNGHGGHFDSTPYEPNVLPSTPRPLTVAPEKDPELTMIAWTVILVVDAPTHRFGDFLRDRKLLLVRHAPRPLILDFIRDAKLGCYEDMYKFGRMSAQHTVEHLGTRLASVYRNIIMMVKALTVWVDETMVGYVDGPTQARNPRHSTVKQWLEMDFPTFLSVLKWVIECDGQAIDRLIAQYDPPYQTHLSNRMDAKPAHSEESSRLDEKWKQQRTLRTRYRIGSDPCDQHSCDPNPGDNPYRTQLNGYPEHSHGYMPMPTGQYLSRRPFQCQMGGMQQVTTPRSPWRARHTPSVATHVPVSQYPHRTQRHSVSKDVKRKEVVSPVIRTNSPLWFKDGAEFGGDRVSSERRDVVSFIVKASARIKPISVHMARTFITKAQLLTIGDVYDFGSLPSAEAMKRFQGRFDPKYNECIMIARTLWTVYCILYRVTVDRVGAKYNRLIAVSREAGAKKTSDKGASHLTVQPGHGMMEPDSDRLGGQFPDTKWSKGGLKGGELLLDSNQVRESETRWSVPDSGCGRHCNIADAMEMHDDQSPRLWYSNDHQGNVCHRDGQGANVAGTPHSALSHRSCRSPDDKERPSHPVLPSANSSRVSIDNGKDTDDNFGGDCLSSEPNVGDGDPVQYQEDAPTARGMHQTEGAISDRKERFADVVRFPFADVVRFFVEAAACTKPVSKHMARTFATEAQLLTLGDIYAFGSLPLEDAMKRFEGELDTQYKECIVMARTLAWYVSLDMGVDGSHEKRERWIVENIIGRWDGNMTGLSIYRLLYRLTATRVGAEYGSLIAVYREDGKKETGIKEAPYLIVQSDHVECVAHGNTWRESDNAIGTFSGQSTRSCHADGQPCDVCSQSERKGHVTQTNRPGNVRQACIVPEIQCFSQGDQEIVVSCSGTLSNNSPGGQRGNVGSMQPVHTGRQTTQQRRRWERQNGCKRSELQSPRPSTVQERYTSQERQPSWRQHVVQESIHAITLLTVAKFAIRLPVQAVSRSRAMAALEATTVSRRSYKSG